MKQASLFLLSILVTGAAFSQDLKEGQVPPVVKASLNKQFPAAGKTAGKVSWEKEKGNYEANWGGRSGEDNSAQFTPSGVFIELVENIPVSSLPARIAPYVTTHYNKAKIREAGKVTDAAGHHTYEAEIKGKDLIFDLDGNFIKEDH
jgi:hypothetical protein